MKGKIAEVFDSMQGEGIYLGEKQLFVRFFGCNLSCRFCDTPLHSFAEYEPQELLDELRLYPAEYHSIAFTGGEPLLQVGFLKEVARQTAQERFRNYLETNGTLPDELEEVIDYFDIVAMDLKLPSSTGLGNFWALHRRFLSIASRKETFLKAVICKETDKNDIMEAVQLIKDTNPGAVLVMQPNSLEDSRPMRKKLEQLKELCLQEQVTACVIPQIHKMVWVR